MTRRRFLEDSILAVAGVASPLPARTQESESTGLAAQAHHQSLTVGVVQQAREPELPANRDKIVRFIGQAKARGCRLVVFPEDALGSPVGTSNQELEEAVDTVRDAARSNDVYAIFCSPFVIPGFAPDRRGHCLRVVGPDGRILLRFNKLICDLPPSDPRRAPGVFYVDGIPCCAMICADRWLRGFEELPVTLGAKILIDCSANARREWIPDFAWYLPVTRALRNNVFSIFCNMGEHPKWMDEPRHGHSAIINPDGAFAAAADDAGDQMLVATLDLSKAHGAEARRRHNHPVFRPYWDLGRRILQGEKANIALPEPYVSPQVEITIAIAQMACSRDIATNLERMARLIGEAAGNRADVVAFPELAVTGAIANDITGADARWNEIGELAAVRGSQLVFNLSYDEEVSDAAALRRMQFWVQLASFCTFSATVNAADPQEVVRPSVPANGGSAIWEDFNGHRKKPEGDFEVFSQYSACRVVSAGRQEKIIYARRTIPKLNPYFARLVAWRYPHLEPWYHLGARIVAGDP